MSKMLDHFSYENQSSANSNNSRSVHLNKRLGWTHATLFHTNTFRVKNDDKIVIFKNAAGTYC